VLAVTLDDGDGFRRAASNGVQNSPYKTAYNWRRAAMAGWW
jgi:hypothetical protein